MRHIRLYEEFSEEDFKDLLSDMEGLGYGHSGSEIRFEAVYDTDAGDLFTPDGTGIFSRPKTDPIWVVLPASGFNTSPGKFNKIKTIGRIKVSGTINEVIDGRTYTKIKDLVEELAEIRKELQGLGDLPILDTESSKEEEERYDKINDLGDREYEIIGDLVLNNMSRSGEGFLKKYIEDNLSTNKIKSEYKSYIIKTTKSVLKPGDSSLSDSDVKTYLDSQEIIRQIGKPQLSRKMEEEIYDSPTVGDFKKDTGISLKSLEEAAMKKIISDPKYKNSILVSPPLLPGVLFRIQLVVRGKVQFDDFIYP